MERETDARQQAAAESDKPGIASHLIAASFGLTVLGLFAVYLSLF